MPRKKKVKQVTVPELQAFLNGAMEFNADNWLPDGSQWKRIVEMIMNLKPEEPQVVVQNTGDRLLPKSNRETILDDSNLGDSNSNAAVTEFRSSMESSAPKTDMRTDNTEELHSIVEGKDENGVISSGKKFKTKNRDDSDGMQESEYK